MTGIEDQQENYRWHTSITRSIATIVTLVVYSRNQQRTLSGLINSFITSPTREIDEK